LNIRNRVRELRTVKAAELTPNPRNWRTHPKAQQDALRGILAEVGYADALLARELSDGTLMLVDGHLRAETTPEQEVPVLVLDIDEAEADKLLLSLDPLAALAETNAQALDTLLREVDTGSEGLQQMYADMAEVADLYKDDTAEVVEDEVPEPPAEPVTKPGDLWLLGEHRLMCGDSTKAEDVERLMSGCLADIMVTDPPYGVAYHSNKKGKKAASIEGDLTQAAIPISFSMACDFVLSENARVYLFGGTANWPMYGKLFDHKLRMQPRPIIWVKESFVLHPTHYHSQFEICFFGWKGSGGGSSYWYGDRTCADVWNVKRDSNKDREHPTQKPVEVSAIPIRNSCPPNGSIYEPFCGSGTTLIAAEQLGRKCYGMEISPQYCDVIVKRWETLTGKQAELEKPNGKTRTTARADDTEDSQGQPRKAAAKQARAKARK